MKKLASLLMSLALLSACVCGAAAEAAPQPEDFADSAARLSLEGYLEADPELTALMEKSLALAHEINPDPVTNPVDSVDKLLDYVDWLTTLHAVERADGSGVSDAVRPHRPEH